MQEEVKHYKVKSLPTLLRPNSVYYVKATSQSAVKTYITDQTGFPFPLVDLTGTVQSVTGTGVTGTSSNPVVNISTFKSSQLGNLIELSSLDGKLFVKPITSPDGSIDIVSTATSLEIQLGASLQTQIQNALQPGDNVSELNNDAGYITLADIPFSAVSATAWTPNHTVATGNPYLAGTVVYYLGHIFQANFNNDSIVPAIGGNLYWTDLGVGYLIDQEQTDWLAVSGSAFIKNKPTNVSSFTNDAGYLTQQAVLEFANLAAFPPVGASNTIYIALDTDIAYYWDGTAYVVVTTSTSGITGFGTVNTLPKFTPTGSQLGNSRFTDNGLTGRYGSTTNYVEFITGGNTFLRLFRSQATFDVILGNPQINQELILDSTNNFGNVLRGRAYWAFRVGALGTTEALRLLATGQLQLPQTPATGTTSDFLLMRDTSGNVRQIAYPTIPAGGLPPGGTAGQILTKVDATDYNATWQDNYADWTSVVKHIVKNDGTALITKGTPVYVTGADGTNMLVRAASNTSEATSSKTMGLMQSNITTTGGTQTGFVVTEGLLGGLNTAGQTAGDPVWLGAGGTLLYGLINKPYAPAHLVFIGIVTKVSAGNGEIFVKVQNGFELEELHNVDLETTVPVNGHILGYDGTLWVNKTIAAWLGYTPANDSTFLYDKFMTNQFSYFLPMDSITLYDTLRVGGTLTSIGTVSALSETPMGVLYTTPSTAGSVAGLYGSSFGGSGYLGSAFQFEIIRKFRINTNNGAQRLFIGISSLYNTTAPTNVEPTNLLNSIGLAKLQGSPNLHFVWNDNTGTASSLDLGSGFLGTDTACTYKLRIYKLSNVPVVFIELTKIVNSTGVVTSTSYNITGDYNTGVSYFPFLWIGNNTGGAGACSIKDYGCIQVKRNIIAS
jgi:hypothetical protein